MHADKSRQDTQAVHVKHELNAHAVNMRLWFAIIKPREIPMKRESISAEHGDKRPRCFPTRRHHNKLLFTACKELNSFAAKVL